MSVSPFFKFYTINAKTKVLLYNFFEDSPATIGQWRLVLNGVSDENGFSDAPTFDEMHHASICTEVYYLQPKHFHRSPLMLSGFAVEIVVSRNYPGSEQALDRGRLRVRWADEGARDSRDPENPSHS